MNRRNSTFRGLALASSLFAIVLTGCRMAHPSAALTPPPAPREFRAAWVATVENIDWPSKPGLSTDEQKQEIVAIVDRAAELKLNALVLQVRTSCDAFYDSKIEPWSQYLTGTQGQAPSPYYDPLKFWVDESHKRGIELHAWFNPYRARHTAAKGGPADDHVSKTHPEIVKSFNGWQWLDPGEPAAAAQTRAVFKDVTHRYAIDGVHMDDYFYPYPEYLTDKATGKVDDFPDADSYARYQKAGGKLLRNDWRRSNVDRLIEQIDKTVHAERKDIKFGISPFGIGRPDRRPEGIKGFSQYDELFADCELWLGKGWCDYLTPQLYWPIESKNQPFPVLLSYWKNQDSLVRHIWPGLYTSKMIEHGDKPWAPSEIEKQIGVTRALLGTDAGHVHFSMKALMRDNGGLSANLQRDEYKLPALVPASRWLDHAPPPAPGVKVVGVGSQNRSVNISPNWTFIERPWLYAIWTRENGGWIFHVQPATESVMQIDTNVSAVVVTAVDHSGNESSRVTVELKQN